MNAMDEAALIRQAQRGDLDSFNRLVLAYQGLAYNVAFRIMGEAASAEDATQEAFLSAYRAIARFRGGSFRGWMLRIVTHACYDELRRRRRRPAVSLEEFEGDPQGGEGDSNPALASPGDGPEASAERTALARGIQDCLERLPDEFRVVAVLADVQELEYQEVAAAIGKPVGTVKSRLARARARLRDCLQGLGELLPAGFRLESETIR
jgi:RNA polymerase sigma-70 factor (ECF subfamily)